MVTRLNHLPQEPCGAQPPAFTTRSDDDGNFFSQCAGRMGRGEKLPPQFGHTPPRISWAHSGQKVHSNEQMTASASGGRSLLQHSQFGRSWSMFGVCWRWADRRTALF